MKKYLIDFRIYEQTWRDSYGRTCPDCVNEDNVEAWRRYVGAKISELMTDETMQKPEFQKILEQVKEGKRKREEYERREKELRIRHADERQRRSSMERPKITYIPKGLTVDYTEEYQLGLRPDLATDVRGEQTD